MDVLRATSTIAQALASGFRRILCCAEIDEARALRVEIPDSLLGGERNAVRIEGFDVGASPREFLEPLAETLILSTTNGTKAILETANRCDDVVLGSLLNLSAVASAVQGRDALVVCAGFQGAFALDDAYCAGRIVELLEAERSDAAIGAALIAQAFPTALEDRFHQSYRAHLAPGLSDILKLRAPGLLGCALSGAGPSIIVFYERGCEPVCDLVRQVLALHGHSSEVLLTPVDEHGFTLEEGNAA